MGDIADMMFDNMIHDQAERDNTANWYFEKHDDKQIIEWAEETLKEIPEKNGFVSSVISFYKQRKYISEKQKYALCRFVANNEESF